jgi:ABC-type multidrug transport system ATPase subunit
MTTCPHCQAPLNNPNAKHCGVCGRPLQPAGKPVTGLLPAGNTQRIAGGVITIGRDPASTLPLNSPVVSWHHAQVDGRQSPPVLIDTSTNGTYVNGQRVKHAQLKPGDIIQIATFRLSYDQLGLTPTGAVGGHRLDGRNLNRKVSQRRGLFDFTGKPKVILNDVSVSIYPREFVGVVGGSGSGKSTLIKALTGFERAQSGQVSLDGEDVYAQFNRLSPQMGYVPQKDIIHFDLPVRRALYYAARLRLPPDTSEQQINKRIDDVLDDLKLTEHANTIVKRLSGGQQKRVNIAVEMLADPKLFFLDEPTSGLDPGLDRTLMQLLRKLAHSGRTILVVTHATESIGECDMVAFMANGRLVYFGPPADALKHFGVSKFSEIYGKLEDDDPKKKAQLAQQAEQHYRASPDYQAYVQSRLNTAPAVPIQKGVIAKKPRRDLLLRQSAILTMRYAELVLRDRLLLLLLLIVMPVIGLLLSLLVKEGVLIGQRAYYDAETVIFMMSFAIVLLGIFAASFEIAKEREIFQRERMVNLRLPAYLGSKVFVLGVFAVAQCALFLAAMRLSPKPIALPDDTAGLFTTLLIASLASILLGLLISTFAPSTDSVIYLVLGVVIVQVMFGGTLFPSVPQEVAGVTLVRWAMTGLGSIADIPSMPQLNKEDATKDMPDDYINKPARDAEVKLKIDYRHEFAAIASSWVVMACFAALYAALILAIQSIRSQWRLKA